MGYKFTFDTIAITGATGTIGISLIKGSSCTSVGKIQ
jgi:FlaA1/EpsC-like NDP-sugar epimerase